MIHSSGQILTGKAATVIENAIANVPDADGFYRTAYKAVCFPKTAPTEDSDVYGTWIEEGAEGQHLNFLGIIGNDTTPEPNLDAGTTVLNSRKPVLEYGANRTLQKGDVVTIERNGMMSVIASADIKEGDLITLGKEGGFKSTTNQEEVLGRAYQSAKEGERFVAYIQGV
jgi:hypothetical protein